MWDLGSGFLPKTIRQFLNLISNFAILTMDIQNLIVHYKLPITLINSAEKKKNLKSYMFLEI